MSDKHYTIDGRPPRTVPEYALCLDAAEMDLAELRQRLSEAQERMSFPPPKGTLYGDPEEIARVVADRQYAMALRGLVDRAVAVLAAYAPPDGPSQQDTISALYSIFDGPEYRAALAKNPPSSVPLSVSAETSVSRSPGTTGLDTLAGGGTHGDEPLTVDFQLQQRTAETLDAERYRYLRNIAGQYADDEDGPMVCDGLGDNFEFLRGEEVDASVDAAMEAWKAAGSPVPTTLSSLPVQEDK